MRKIHKLVPAVALALAASEAAAQVLYEPFNYTSTPTNGTTLDASPTDSDVELASPNPYKHYSTQGTYWAKTGTSTANPVVFIEAGNLTPNSIGPMILPDPQGNRSRQSGANTARTPRLGLGQLVQGEGSQIFYSAAVNMSSFPSNTTAEGADGAIIGFNNFSMPGGTNPSAVAAGLRIRRTPGSTTTYQVGLMDWGAPEAAIVWDETHNFATADTIFVVARATLGAGAADDVYDLWVNPSSDFGAAAAPTPTLSLTSTRDITDPGVGSTIASVWLNPTGGTGGPRVDELRVDSTWAGVTPDGNLQYTWNSGSAGNLADATWTAKAGAPAATPNGRGHVANFGAGIAAGTINTAGETLDTININNANGLTIGGSGLTIDSNASAGQIVALQGNHTIAAPLTLAKDLAIKTGRLPGIPVSAPGRITLSAPITGAGRTISTYGVGTVALGAEGVFAADQTLAVRSGTFDTNGFNTSVQKLVLGVGHTNPGTDSSTQTTADLATGSIIGTGVITIADSDLQSGTIAAGIAGTAGVVKNNQASVTLSGSNTYTGDTVVNNGTLILAGTNSNTVNAVIKPPIATGGSTSTLSIASDANLGPAPLAPTPVITMTTHPNTGGTLAITGDMTLNANRTITANAGISGISVASGKTATVPGLITGTGGIAKGGDGTLILTGANDYAGNTVVSGGVLRVNAASGLGTSAGTVFVAGGTNAGASASLELDGAAGDITVAEATTIEGKSSGGGGNATPHIRSLAGNNAFTSAVKLDAAGTWFNLQADAGKLTIAGIDNPIAAGANRIINLRGAGAGEITGNIVNTNADGGGAVALSKFDAGTWTLSGGSTHRGPTAASGGKLVLGKSLTTSSSLAASNDAVIELASDGSKNQVIKTGELTITGTAKVDIRDNKLITTTPVGTATGGVYAEGSVHRMVQTAYQESAWGGPGLMTSMDDAKSGLTTVAVATGEQIGVTTFAGQSVAPTDTIAFYTYGGDTNFDGKLDADDYGTIDFNVLLPGPIDGYYNGDFNYDGVVNADDYGVIDFNILAQTTPFPTGGDAAIASSSAGLAGVTAVPEPASLSVLGLAAASLLGRRRRRAE